MGRLISMTGYGRGQTEGMGRTFIVECRSVNNRYLDVQCRIPRDYSVMEDKIKGYVKERVNRGRVDINLSVEYLTGSSRNFILDEELAIQAYNAMNDLASRLDIKSGPTVHDIIGIPDIIRLEEPEDDIDMIWQIVSEALDQGLSMMIDMRSAEGARLKSDLLHRIVETEQLISGIQGRSPLVIDEYKNRLLERVHLLSDGLNLDQERLETEVALFADKACIDEELVRLASHIKEFKETINVGDVVGRKLDFILQECNRETNTIGSKANDYEIGRLVIEIKSQLEKLREQVQNIE